MELSADDLPNDIAELKRLLIAAKSGLVAKTLETEKLKFELARLKRMAFGQSSERLDREIEQLELKLEEIETARAESASPVQEEDTSDWITQEERRGFPTDFPMVGSNQVL